VITLDALNGTLIAQNAINRRDLVQNVPNLCRDLPFFNEGAVDCPLDDYKS